MLLVLVDGVGVLLLEDELPADAGPPGTCSCGGILALVLSGAVLLMTGENDSREVSRVAEDLPPFWYRLSMFARARAGGAAKRTA